MDQLCKGNTHTCLHIQNETLNPGDRSHSSNGMNRLIIILKLGGHRNVLHWLLQNPLISLSGALENHLHPEKGMKRVISFRYAMVGQVMLATLTGSFRLSRNVLTHIITTDSDSDSSNNNNNNHEASIGRQGSSPGHTDVASYESDSRVYFFFKPACALEHNIIEWR